MLEYLIVGDADFELYANTLRIFSEEERIKLANGIINATDDIRKEVISILEKKKEGAE